MVLVIESSDLKRLSSQTSVTALAVCCGPQKLEAFVRKLRRVCADSDTRFVGWKGGVWRFEVEHF
jgi:hypothetical protein